MVQGHARAMSKKLGRSEFSACTGWIAIFRKTSDCTYRSLWWSGWRLWRNFGILVGLASSTYV